MKLNTKIIGALPLLAEGGPLKAQNGAEISQKSMVKRLEYLKKELPDQTAQLDSMINTVTDAAHASFNKDGYVIRNIQGDDIKAGKDKDFNMFIKKAVDLDPAVVYKAAESSTKKKLTYEEILKGISEVGESNANASVFNSRSSESSIPGPLNIPDMFNDKFLTESMKAKVLARTGEVKESPYLVSEVAQMGFKVDEKGVIQKPAKVTYGKMADALAAGLVEIAMLLGKTDASKDNGFSGLVADGPRSPQTQVYLGMTGYEAADLRSALHVVWDKDQTYNAVDLAMKPEDWTKLEGSGIKEKLERLGLNMKLHDGSYHLHVIGAKANTNPAVKHKKDGGVLKFQDGGGGDKWWNKKKTDEFGQEYNPITRTLGQMVTPYAFPAAVGAFNMLNKAKVNQKPYMIQDTPVRPIQGMMPFLRRQQTNDIMNATASKPGTSSARMNALTQVQGHTQRMSALNQLNSADAQMYSADKTRYYKDLSDKAAIATAGYNKNIEMTNNANALNAADLVKRRASAAAGFSDQYTQNQADKQKRSMLEQMFTMQKNREAYQTGLASLDREYALKVNPTAEDLAAYQAAKEALNEKYNNPQSEMYDYLNKEKWKTLY